MFEAFVERQARTSRANQILIALRLLLATVSLAVLLIEDVQTVRSAAITTQLEAPLYQRPAGLIAIIVCLLTIVYVLIAKYSGKERESAAKLAFAQVFVDIFLISALVWHTGGVESQFIVLYLISVCSAAFVLKWNVAVLAAAMATILFSSVALLYNLGVIPLSFRMHSTTVQLAKLQNLGILDFFRLLLLPAVAFFLTGALAGTLSRRSRLARSLHDEILEGIGEGIVVLDAGRKALYHNREFQRLLGLGGVEREANDDDGTRPEPALSLKSRTVTVTGRSLKDLLGSAIDQQAQEVLEECKARRIEASHRLEATGRIVPFAIRIIPMMDPDSALPRGLVMALDDITAERKMEEFLKHRQRIEAMGHISATIAHEIRNPLASIRGAVQEIGRAVTIPEDKKVLLEIVLSESDRLDQIITDFLRFARMRPPKLNPTDIGRVLADVKLLLCSRPEAKDVQISLSGDEGDPFPADSEQLRQLFLNLGVNALQAMSGSVRRELALRVSVMPRHRVLGFAQDQALDRPGVQVEMSDSGPGMPSDVRSHIFEPFFTTKATGTGLGLAIAERIVQAHEGLITFDSREGAGTTFRIWLPANLSVPPAGISGFRPVIADSAPANADVLPRPRSARQIKPLGS